MDKQVFLKVKDYSVSQEEFELLYDDTTDMLITSPKPEALGKYYESENYISHTDGNKTFFEKIYQNVKQFTLRKKVNLITSFNTEGKKLLDIGAGTADFLVTAKQAGWDVQGIEPNSKAIGLAKQKEIILHTSLASVTDERFDVITLWHVLEHVPDVTSEIKKITQLLKPNGVLVIAVPNYKSFDAVYYKNFWAAYDVPRHLFHFSKNSIERLFNIENYKVRKILPMYFDAFYVSLLSEKYKTGKMNFIKGICIGAYSNGKGLFSKEFSSHIYVLTKAQN
jgi:2-polyprenyl-3-methyl-5-hydroxy-6-metoxy-1,4-benzoquinol methylase